MIYNMPTIYPYDNTSAGSGVGSTNRKVKAEDVIQTGALQFISNADRSKWNSTTAMLNNTQLLASNLWPYILALINNNGGLGGQNEAVSIWRQEGTLSAANTNIINITGTKYINDALDKNKIIFIVYGVLLSPTAYKINTTTQIEIIDSGYAVPDMQYQIINFN